MTKPSYEEPGSEVAKVIEGSRNHWKRRAETADSELARVRGLLQRQWISVEERLPETEGEYLVYRGTSNFAFKAELQWFYNKDVWTRGFYEDGEQDTNVTHWMPLPDPPTLPQSSSLVPEGAESADIGKLDAADKQMPICLACGIVGKHLCAYSAGVEMGKVNRVEDGISFDQQLLEELENQIARRNCFGLDCEQLIQVRSCVFDALCVVNRRQAGSAETVGEKAALRSLIQAIENCAIADSGPNGINAGRLRDALVSAKAALANFPRTSQNQKVSSGVERAHEGTTADKSELLPTQLPKEK